MKHKRAAMANGETVSVVMARKIKPGCEQQFWAVDKEIKDAMKRCPGLLAVNDFPLQQPTDAENEGDEFLTIAQFDNMESLSLWEESPLRAELLSKFEPLVVGDMRRKSISGLEGMFESSIPAAPPKYKMAILIIVVIFSQLIILKPLINMTLGFLPEILQSLILVTIQVVAMAYLIMPYLTKKLAKWLYKP